MHVSLVLATLNRTVEVGRFVRSLFAQTDQSFELIVVDQNRDDRLVPLISDAQRAGMAVRHERVARPGLANARNIGIQLARHAVVGFPDDDCWYEPDTVQQLRDAFATHPLRAGVVAQWVEQSSARPPPCPAGDLSLAQWRCFRGGDASSISLFFKREVLIQLNGFDTRFGVGQWYGAAEETDLMLRALTAGAVITHCPEARVHHHFSTAPPNDWLAACRSIRKRARGTGGIYRKHRLAPLIIARGLSAPVLIPLLQGRPRSIAIGACTALGRLEGWICWTIKETS